MAAEPCKKCGKLRKIDIIISSDGWHQPACYNCGDPAYIELINQFGVSQSVWGHYQIKEQKLGRRIIPFEAWRNEGPQGEIKV